jgi:hypothetical protein
MSFCNKAAFCFRENNLIATSKNSTFGPGSTPLKVSQLRDQLSRSRNFRVFLFRLCPENDSIVSWQPFLAQTFECTKPFVSIWLETFWLGLILTKCSAELSQQFGTVNYFKSYIQFVFDVSFLVIRN